MGYSQTTKEISDELIALQAITQTLYNGNPSTMYAYNENWYDGNQYTFNSGGYDYQTFVSTTIDVTDMRYILGRMNFKWHYTGGGATAGTKKGRIIVNDDATLSYRILDPDYGIYDEGGTSDEPADNVVTTFYVYMLVNDLTGSQTVKFQGRRGGVNNDIYGDESYLYEQIIN